MKTFLKAFLGLLVLLALVFMWGPREQGVTLANFAEGSVDADIDQYLTNVEAFHRDIKPGAEKQMIWFDPATKSKQPYSIVYLHGFSATLEEIRPVPDILAQALQANIFYTRFKGHGRGGDAMAEASVNDWMNDVAEALTIGRATGEKVIIVGTSTGATLASIAATQPPFMTNVEGIVMVAPNFGVKATGADVLLWPWARQLAPLAFGEYREWEPKNKEQRKWWTTRYPTVSLLPMQAAVREASNIKFEDLKVPVLAIFHPKDGVVKSDLTRQIMARWGKNTLAKSETMEVTDSEDTMNHVIAGDILSPKNTQPVADKAIEWIKSL